MLDTPAAQRRVQSGEHAPRVRLTVGEHDLTRDMTSEGSKVSYAISEGESELSLAVHRDLRELVNSEVTLEVGYGDALSRYFTGKLYDRDTAYSAFKLLAEQSFDDEKDFRGFPIDIALYEIFSLAGMRGQQYEIRPGDRHILAGDVSRFRRNVGLKEAIDQLVENAGRVVADLPNGVTLVRPAPNPGSTSTPDAVYDQGSIPLDDDGLFMFTAEQGSFTRNLYAAVRVFRDPNEEGDPGVDVTVPVSVETREKPPPNRYYNVGEFTGDEQAAWDVAAKYASLLGRGTFDCSLGPVPFNPDIEPYSTIEATTEEYERPLAGGKDERFQRTYSYLVDDSIELELGTPHDHSASGEGVLLEERRLAKPYPVTVAPREAPYRAPFGVRPDGTSFITTGLPFVYVTDDGNIQVDVEGAEEYGFRAYMTEDYELKLEATR